MDTDPAAQEGDARHGRGGGGGRRRRCSSRDGRARTRSSPPPGRLDDRLPPQDDGGGAAATVLVNYRGDKDRTRFRNRVRVGVLRDEEGEGNVENGVTHFVGVLREI
mmetsp:Transcript_34135/g.102105  ORF Transcript_34135/g.102105 Transcript_34135/m.102105 type:complete len:107 (-) Transcript_34135:307-627(-)